MTVVDRLIFIVSPLNKERTGFGKVATGWRKSYMYVHSLAPLEDKRNQKCIYTICLQLYWFMDQFDF